MKEKEIKFTSSMGAQPKGGLVEEGGKVKGGKLRSWVEKRIERKLEDTLGRRKQKRNKKRRMKKKEAEMSIEK